MGGKRRLTGFLVGLGLLAPAAAPASTQLADTPDPGPVSAKGGVVAWPVRDGERWSIRAVTGSSVVRPSLGPFSRMPHVSVGSFAGGRQSLLYDRCGTRACGLYRYDVDRGQPRRVLQDPPGVPCRRLSSAAGSGSALVFLATGCEGKRTRRLFHRARGGRVRALDALTPQPGIAFGSGAVAYVDTHSTLPGHGSQGNIVVLSPRKGGRRVFDSGVLPNGYSKTPMIVHGETTIRVTSPTIDGGLLHWLKIATSRKGDDYEVLTARLADGERCASRRLTAERGAPESIAVDAGRLYYTTPQGVFEDTEPRVTYDECG